MAQILALVAAIALVGFIAYVATRPNELRVSREATIAAPPERIYAHLANLAAWGPWSPWEKKDPGMKRTFEGPESGVGAVYGWEGNKDVGSGRMEVTKATPPSCLAIDLHFLKPFEARNTAEFTLEATGAATRVVWVMFGPANFMSKLMGVFMNMDRMIGSDFEAGLANLKALCEKPAA
jgi:hypothetical protein